MAEIETPEADALEQNGQPALEDAEPILGVEIPEADAIEQAQGTTPTQSRVIRPIRDDVPEADAWEQSVDVVIDDDYEH